MTSNRVQFIDKFVSSSSSNEMDRRLRQSRMHLPQYSQFFGTPIWSPNLAATKIQKKPELSQRKMAEDLGFSLGKLNYCLSALVDKGLVKIENFKSKKNKAQYFRYVITPKGISERTKLTLDFMQRKMKEYDELKKELKEK